MRASAEALREREVAHALRRLQHLAPEERAAIDELSKSLMNKFLHAPTVRLRQAAANGRGLGVVDTARYLFDLENRMQSTATPGAPPTGTETDE